MIVGGKIISVEARRDNDGESTALNMNINIDDVTEKNGIVSVAYTYSVDYSPGVGSLRMTGLINFKDDGKGREIMKAWREKKQLPADVAEEFINSVTYAGSVNGTLVVRVLNLAPPIVVPRIRVGKPTEVPAEKKAA